jgi:hypothetical protein
VTAFPAVALPSTRAQIVEWVTSEAMAALLAAFGHVPAGAGDPAALLDDLDRFTADRWNYRKDRERNEAETETFPPATDALIRAATAALGLAGRLAPAARDYDHLLVLGGNVRTMLARSELAAALVRGGVRTGTVAGLGSLRPLAGQEEIAREAGLRPCRTEGDAMHEALRRVFPVESAPITRAGTRAGAAWWLRSHPDATPPLHVLAAPFTQAGERADTADTYTGWAELVCPDPDGARLLVVTTDLFVPYQHCEAVRLLGLPYGCSVDTVGFPTAANPWVRPARTSDILQEVRAAIRSMGRLLRAVTSGRPR